MTTFKLNDLRPAYKVPVKKDMGNGISEVRAEILFIRTSSATNNLEFFVHYVNYNKRLDEWVDGSAFVLNKVEMPRKRRGVRRSPSVNDSNKKDTSKLTRNEEDENTKEEELDNSADLKENENKEIEDKEKKETENKESEKISTEKREEMSSPLKAPKNTPIASPSTTLAVKTINNLHIRNTTIETWYFSPYPSYIQSDIWLCPTCLFYFGDKNELQKHKCKLHHPPGREIYRKDDLSFFELDGHIHKNFCRNISLLSKCFLDHKTLFYDVDLFMFYVLCRYNPCVCSKNNQKNETKEKKNEKKVKKNEHKKNDEGENSTNSSTSSLKTPASDLTPKHKSICNTFDIVGYFSKEKVPSQGYNLACVLVMPHEQRKGYGKILIDFSYLLSKQENVIASPEKPLSDLGYLSYLSYWKGAINDVLLSLGLNKKKSSNLSDKNAEKLSFDTEKAAQNSESDSVDNSKKRTKKNETLHEIETISTDTTRTSLNKLQTISLDKLSTLTAITIDDLLLTLSHYKMVQFVNGDICFIVPEGAKKQTQKVDKNALKWNGHCFNRNMLRLL